MASGTSNNKYHAEADIVGTSASSKLCLGNGDTSTCGTCMAKFSGMPSQMNSKCGTRRPDVPLHDHSTIGSPITTCFDGSVVPKPTLLLLSPGPDPLEDESL